MLIEKKLFTRVNLINLLIAVLPLSLIIGNSAVNINVVLICLAGIMTYKFELFRINEKIYQYLIFSFFLYLILITLITNIPLILNYVQKTHPFMDSSRDLYIENIIKSVSELLTNKDEYKKMSLSHNPYGDGKSCDRIIEILSK